MGDPRDISRSGGAMSELSEARLWKTLDGIGDSLNDVQNRLNELVRLQERVSNHEQALARYGDRLDSHDSRLRESELWQANYGDKSSVERLITHVQEDVKKAVKRIDELESGIDVTKGQKDVAKEIFKWVSGILAAILVIAIKGE